MICGHVVILWYCIWSSMEGKFICMPYMPINPSISDPPPPLSPLLKVIIQLYNLHVQFARFTETDFGMAWLIFSPRNIHAHCYCLWLSVCAWFCMFMVNPGYVPASNTPLWMGFAVYHLLLLLLNSSKIIGAFIF